MTIRTALRGLITVFALSAIACDAAFANTVKPTPAAVAAAGARFDVNAWDKLLKKYVDDKGRVDYQKLKADPADMQSFEQVFAQVAAQKLDALPSKSAKEAFLLNAYNVCVWKNVIDRLPKLKSVNDEKTSFFYFTKFLVGGKETSLYSLEGDAIRPVFKDPRVHMALNCASGGCPQLPPEAFDSQKLDSQLDREATKFVNEDRNVHYDAASNTASLSHIFDWYDKDFDKHQIHWINQHRPKDRQIPETAKLKFVDYDWRLNDTSLPR